MHHIATTRLAVLAACALLAGCITVGPDYQRPGFDLPAASAAMPEQETWWSLFQDPVLDALLQEAMANNQDMVIAAARVAEARAMAAVVGANRAPSVDLVTGAARARISETSGKLLPNAPPTAANILIGLNASYEIDFWGKFSRANEAARARLLAQQANRGVVQTGLRAGVAQTYFMLRAFDAQLVLAESTRQTRIHTLTLQQERHAVGKIGALDLFQAESEAAAADIVLEQARQSVALTESALALLLGRSPAAISRPAIARGAAIRDLYARIVTPANLPSDLLNRRPDILRAEQALVAANADLGQAKAAYFPSVRLTSAAGYESLDVAELLKPTSLLWNLGANLLQPLFRGGAIKAGVEGANARTIQARAQYIQSVQNAFRDVHDALVNLRSSQRIHTAARTRADALEASLELATIRYESGHTSYQDLLDAQRDLQQTQVSLIDTQRAHLSALVALYTAVGGGWERLPDRTDTAVR